jgi:hypothetical protein
VTAVLSQSLYTGDCFLSGECLGTLSIPPFNENIEPTGPACALQNIDECGLDGNACCVGLESDGVTFVNFCCTAAQWLYELDNDGVYYPVNV